MGLDPEYEEWQRAVDAATGRVGALEARWPLWCAVCADEAIQWVWYADCLTDVYVPWFGSRGPAEGALDADGLWVRFDGLPQHWRVDLTVPMSTCDPRATLDTGARRVLLVEAAGAEAAGRRVAARQALWPVRCTWTGPLTVDGPDDEAPVTWTADGLAALYVRWLDVFALPDAAIDADGRSVALDGLPPADCESTRRSRRAVLARPALMAARERERAALAASIADRMPAERGRLARWLHAVRIGRRR